MKMEKEKEEKELVACAFGHWYKPIKKTPHDGVSFLNSRLSQETAWLSEHLPGATYKLGVLMHACPQSQH